jgi:glycosyltransferase involved in cell wall biosynthesis
MRFSIVTPSFNQGAYIRDCVESARAQTGVEWEHLVMDGGSTDETLRALAEFPHLKVISEPDEGQSDAINKGFRRASGEWVMWLNADDYLLPGALAAVEKFASEHPEADVIYGGWDFVTATRERTKRMKMFPFDLRMLIYHGPYIGSTACFFRKRTTIDAGYLLNPRFHQCMDMEYYARLGWAGRKFVHCPDILAAFRIHGDNASMRHLEARDIDAILQRQLQLAEGAAIRRAYGHTLFGEPFADGIVDGLLWYFFRFKKIAVKLCHGCYR